MPLLSLEQLKALVVLKEEGNVTRVAQRLGRTQPAISLQLKRLEEQVGQGLFDRSANRLTLTTAGEVLLNYAQQILQLNDEALAHFELPEISGRINLGIPSEFAVTILPKIIGRFAKAYPEVTLEVTCDLSRNLLAADPQRFDLVLALHDKIDKTAKGFLMLDPLVWVASPRTLSSLYDDPTQALPLIAAPDGCIYRKRALQVLSHIKRDCRLVYTIPDLQGISAALEEGLGITVLAKSTVPADLNIISDSNLPKLGYMGISLQRKKARNQAAVDLLAGSIEEGLRI